MDFFQGRLGRRRACSLGRIGKILMGAGILGSLQISGAFCRASVLGGLSTGEKRGRVFLAEQSSAYQDRGSM